MPSMFAASNWSEEERQREMNPASYNSIDSTRMQSVILHFYIFSSYVNSFSGLLQFQISYLCLHGNANVLYVHICKFLRNVLYVFKYTTNCTVPFPLYEVKHFIITFLFMVHIFVHAFIYSFCKSSTLDLQTSGKCIY